MNELTYWRDMSRRLLLAFEDYVFTNMCKECCDEQIADQKAFEFVQEKTGIRLSEFDSIFTADYEEAYETYRREIENGE